MKTVKVLLWLVVFVESWKTKREKLITVTFSGQKKVTTLDMFIHSFNSVEMKLLNSSENGGIKEELLVNYEDEDIKRRKRLK